MRGVSIGSQESDKALAIESAAKAASSTPTISRSPSRTPMTSLPPDEFANATRVLTYFLLLAGSDSFNSSVFDSPPWISLRRP